MGDKFDLILQRLDKLDQIESELKSISERVTDIESNMATKDDLDVVKEMVASVAESLTEIKSKQSKHQIVLEKLSFRSIRQEAELGDIKAELAQAE